MKPRQRVVALLALTLTGCLKPPVTESLQLSVLHGGASWVSVEIELRDPSDYDKTARVRQRLESEARALEEGNDAWSRRIRSADPESQQDLIARERGRVRRVVRAAVLSEPVNLQNFFRDTDVGVAFAAGEGWAELTLTPGRPSRATSSQRAKVGAALSAFSAQVASYSAATRGLYDYLATNPARARACFGGIFDVKTDEGELTDEESALVASVNDAIGALGSVLEPDAGEPYTLDETSRLVYDPFPAPVLVAVDGEIVERDGFSGDLASPLRIPAFSIWSAFERLEGRWLSPDPALAIWRHDLADTALPFDLEAFVALSRRAGAIPTATEVRTELEKRLRPSDAYRVRWTPTAPEPRL